MPSLSVRLRLDVSATLNMTDKKMVSFRAKPEESRGNERGGLFFILALSKVAEKASPYYYVVL